MDHQVIGPRLDLTLISSISKKSDTNNDLTLGVFP